MEILSAKELSKYLKINEKMVYRLVQESKLPALRIGGKIAFVKELIDDWILESTEREKTILVAGSDDPLLKRIIDLFNARQKECTVFYALVGSLNGLELLRERTATMACVHILDEEKKSYTLSYMKRFLENGNYTAIRLFFREQGLYLQKGNPRGIESVNGLASDAVRFTNRNKGSGTRLLFDFLLRDAGVEPSLVKGYDQEVESHLAAAMSVFAGRADAALGIQHVASVLDLSFLPLFRERFDLVIPRERFSGRQVRTFLEFLREPGLIHFLQDYQGYDTTGIGGTLD